MVPVRRHARDWRAYLACGGLVLALLIAHPVLADQQGRNDGQAVATEAASEPPPAALSSDPPANADVYAKSCKHPKNTDQANLCIERSSMKATQQQALWAKLTFIITTFGTLAIVVTLSFTASAAKAAEVSATLASQSAETARTQAETAQDSVWFARETAIAQLRAYISLDVLNYETVSTQGEAKAARYLPVWRNYGVTHATNVRYYTHVCISKRYIPIGHEFEVKVSAETGTLIGPGAKELGPSIEIFMISDLQNAIRDGHEFCIYGAIDYTDVFNVQRRTEFFNATKIGEFPGDFPEIN